MEQRSCREEVRAIGKCRTNFVLILVRGFEITVLLDSDKRFVTLHAAKVEADGYLSGILEFEGKLYHDLSDPLPLRHFSYGLDDQRKDSLLSVFGLGRNYGGAFSSSQLHVVSQKNQASLVVGSKSG